MPSKLLEAFGRGLLVLAAITLPESVCAQDVRDGRELFVTYGCWQCHGYEGQGGVAGPRLAPTLLPYVAFAQLVRRPANVMPAYASSALSNSDLEAIFAFLMTIEEPPALERIPVLR